MQSTSPALLEVFRRTYHKTAQQKESYFRKAGILDYDGQDGAIHNYARILPFEVARIDTKNQTSDSTTKTPWTVDNRQWYTYIYYAELLLSREIDVEKAIADPKSSLMENAVAAGNRQIDRVCATAAIGDVSSGAPEQTKATLSFAADQGLTIDMTAGITEALLRKVKQNFTNRGVDNDQQKEAAVFITGSEEAAFLSLDHMVNILYTFHSPENKYGFMRLFDTLKVMTLPGTDANTTVANPVLTEASGVRSCLAIAPRGIVGKIDVIGFEYFPKMETYLDSQLVRFKIEIGACRTEGSLVQLLKTTIETA